MAAPAMAYDESDNGRDVDGGRGMGRPDPSHGTSSPGGGGGFTIGGSRWGASPYGVTPRRSYDGRPIGSRWGRDRRDDRGSEFDSPHGGMGFGRDDSEQGD